MHLIWLTNDKSAYAGIKVLFQAAGFWVRKAEMKKELSFDSNFSILHASIYHSHQES